MSLSGGLVGANHIDSSSWTHHRVIVDTKTDLADQHNEAVHIHYISCKPAPHAQVGTILLIHGFPQTSYQFRRVITPLADAGFHVIAPDYRGAGESSKPWTGYTKDVMARDLHEVVTEHEGVKAKVHVVGHDIGGMIAHAYAVLFPDDTASIAWGECPLPGSKIYESTKASPMLYHFVFQNVPDLPEALVTGRERMYLKHFYDRLAQNPAAISNHDLETYTIAYSQPGALRAAFNVYRAFDADGATNQRWVRDRGKCTIRCLLLNGEKSFLTDDDAEGQAAEFYDHVAAVERVPGAGHYIAEENPVEFVRLVSRWARRE